MMKKYSFVLVAVLVYAAAVYAVPPTISSINLYSNDNGGTTIAAASLSPDDEQTLTFTVSDSDGLAELSRIYIIMYHSGTVARDASDNINYHATYRADFSGAAVSWYLINPQSSGWEIDTAHCSPLSAGGTGPALFTLTFTPSALAVYDNASQWVIRAIAVDQANTSNSNSLYINCGEYLDVNVEQSEAYFRRGKLGGSVPLDVADNIDPFSGDGYVDISVTANFPYSLGMQASNFTGLNDTVEYLSAVGNLSSIVDLTSYTVLDNNTNAIYTSASPTSLYGDSLRMFLNLTYTNTTITNFQSYNYLCIKNTLSGGDWQKPHMLRLDAATVNSVKPTIAAYPIYLTEGENGNDSGERVTYMTTGDEMTFSFYVNDVDGYFDIRSIKVIFWYEPSVTLSSSDSANHATYSWYKHDDYWSINPSSGWSLDYVNSSSISSYSTSQQNQKCLLTFTPSSSATLDDAKNWRITVIVESDNPAGEETIYSKEYSMIAPESTATVPDQDQQKFVGAPAPFLLSGETSEMTFRYYTTIAGYLSVRIYDMGGQLVKVLTDSEQINALTQWTDEWDGKNDIGITVHSGIYYAELNLRKMDGTFIEPQSFIFSVIQ